MIGLVVFGLVVLCLVWLCLAWLCCVWFGLVVFGLVCLGLLDIHFRDSPNSLNGLGIPGNIWFRKFVVTYTYILSWI